MKYLITALLILSGFHSYSQNEEIFPSLSPKGEITQQVGHTLVKIEYERPSVRDRKIFGGLVPYDKVWRTGAGYCTKISFDQPVRIGGQKVEPGKYSLFTIPSPDQWVVILNRDTTLYGSGFYDSSKDVLRFATIPEKTSRFYETLTIDIDLIPNNARIYISWVNTQISFDLETATDELVEAYIRNELVTGKSQDPDRYASAASYFYFQNKDLLLGLQLADHAIEMDREMGWAWNEKIAILRRLKKYDEALIAVNNALQTKKKKEYKNEGDLINSINYWKSIKTEIEIEQIKSANE